MDRSAVPTKTAGSPCQSVKDKTESPLPHPTNENEEGRTIRWWPARASPFFCRCLIYALLVEEPATDGIYEKRGNAHTTSRYHGCPVGWVCGLGKCRAFSWLH